MENSNIWTNIIANIDDFYIERAMHYTCTAPLFGNRHNHNDKFHIAYIITGKSEIVVDSYHYNIGSGDLIMIPANKFHCSLKDDKTFYELIEIHFIFKNNTLISTFPELPTMIHINNTATVLPALERCVSAHLIDPNPNNLLAKLRLFEIFLLIEQETQLIKHIRYTPDLHLKINQAKDYICQNYNQQISVNQLADLVGTSPSYFACSFKKIIGISPIEFLIKMRLCHTKNLLLESNFSIQQIADICGFYSSQYLSRIFCQREKMSPSQYRQKGLNKK